MINEDGWFEPKLKLKYRKSHRGRFKSKSDGRGGKKVMRGDKSIIHQPKKAKWTKHINGSWGARANSR